MQVTTIGLDIAKNVFQVHGIDAAEKVVVRKQLRRRQVLEFFKALPACLVGMEACATAHYWARELTRLGHRVRLMPAKDGSAAYCGRVRARSSISDGRSLARSRRSNGPKLWPNQSVLFRHPTNANSIPWQHSLDQPADYQIGRGVALRLRTQGWPYSGLRCRARLRRLSDNCASLCGLRDGNIG